MSQIGKKLLRLGPTEGYPDGGVGHWCPGCGIMHAFSTEAPNRNGTVALWDGDKAAPSFEPGNSFAWRWPKPGLCAYAVVGGKITFAPGSTHLLAGRTVPLPDLPGHLI
jgi:hypothetical protein